MSPGGPGNHNKETTQKPVGGLICAVTLGLVAHGRRRQARRKTHKADYDAAVARRRHYKRRRGRCKRSRKRRDVCIQEAKAARDKADADAKAVLKSSDAMTTARETRWKRSTRSPERCDSLSGDAKEACVKEVRPATISNADLPMRSVAHEDATGSRWAR
jgi:hypothetical protein